MISSAKNAPETKKCKSLRKISKRIWKFSYTHVPASLKISSLMGSSVFNADYFTRIVFKRASGLDHPFGIITACILLTGVGSTNYLIRYRNMRREFVPNNHNEGCSCAIPYEVKNAGWFTPDKTHAITYSKLYQAGYIGLQSTCILYLFATSFGGVLAGYSLVSLGSSITRLPFNPECGEKSSPAYVLIPVFSFSIMLSLSNMRSFYLYNMQRIRNYYHKYIFHGKYKELSFYTKLKTFLTISVSSMGLFFANRQLSNLIYKNMLCHINAGEPPAYANEIFMYGGAIVNFIINGVLLAPAIHHTLNNQETKVDELLIKLPHWQNWMYPIRVALSVDSLAFMFSVFISVYSLPETVHNEQAEIQTNTTSIIMLIVACILTLNAGFGQYALDFEALITELKATIMDTFQSDLMENLVDTMHGENNIENEEKEITQPEDALTIKIYANPLSPTLYRRPNTPHSTTISRAEKCDEQAKTFQTSQNP